MRHHGVGPCAYRQTLAGCSATTLLRCWRTVSVIQMHLYPEMINRRVRDRDVPSTRCARSRTSYHRSAAAARGGLALLISKGGIGAREPRQCDARFGAALRLGAGTFGPAGIVDQGTIGCAGIIDQAFDQRG